MTRGADSTEVDLVELRQNGGEDPNLMRLEEQIRQGQI